MSPLSEFSSANSLFLVSAVVWVRALKVVAMDLVSSEQRSLIFALVNVLFGYFCWPTLAECF